MLFYFLFLGLVKFLMGICKFCQKAKKSSHAFRRPIRILFWMWMPQTAFKGYVSVLWQLARCTVATGYVLVGIKAAVECVQMYCMCTAHLPGVLHSTVAAVNYCTVEIKQQRATLAGFK
jgi:hypothetical protein